ncbi:MAG: ATP-binding cassette domain-containing protein [Rhodobacteraceae bacterium]|nr:ATP-binding cassette domain-containing protein [Paracoccaceae bacterium]
MGDRMMAEPQDIALELSGVSKTYQISQGIFAASKPLRALDNISLQLRRGEVLGLVGESGCGKSTLAKVLLGLEKPTRGDVRIFDQPFGSHDRKWIARRIQPIFQDPYSSLNPRKSVREIITLPLRVHSVGKTSGWNDEVSRMLDLVGLPQRLIDANPSQMSGGQRQRVAIARALIMWPEVVICDEPTSALDVSVQSQILNLLMDLRDELGLTYLFISHNLAVVEHIASRVAVMYLGRVVEQGPAARIFETPKHPYAVALLDSNLTPDPSMDVPDVDLDGNFPNPVDPPSGCTFHPRCASATSLCSRLRPEPVQQAPGFVTCHLHDPNQQKDMA